MTDERSQRARTLRDLHRGPAPLVLPNAWDAASARCVAGAGFPAVATTSAGVAHSLGWDDHEAAPPEEMFAAVARIARAVPVPVTADIESGYGLPPAALVEALLGAGAVGCNLEDTDHAAGGLRQPDAQAERLGAVRDAAARAGVDLVLNARIDCFLHGDRPADERLDDAIARGRLYREAGADCVYPILLRGPEALTAFVRAVDCPVNVMVLPGGASLGELHELGARRLSFGSGLFARLREALTRQLEEIRSAAPA